MRSFFPQIEPYATHRLSVSQLHTLYVEESGNSKGKPVIFIHGGPGGGTHPDHRRFFNPQVYRIILFDQRGCGQSLPSAALEENTTWDLVADMEKIRSFLGIEKWVVFGGSWGSTLALTYAIQYQERVVGLILRGIFLCRPSEIQWFYQEGASHVFPDYWEKYWNHIETPKRENLVKAYYSLLTSSNESVRIEAARIWSQWEAATSRIFIDSKEIQAFEEPQKALAFARIECHYFINNAFFPTENYILENSHKLKDIPGFIIQGRYDMVCPPRSAWELHKAWQKSQLLMIADAGHSATEPGIRSALLEATEAFQHLYQIQ